MKPHHDMSHHNPANLLNAGFSRIENSPIFWISLPATHWSSCLPIASSVSTLPRCSVGLCIPVKKVRTGVPSTGINTLRRSGGVGMYGLIAACAEASTASGRADTAWKLGFTLRISARRDFDLALDAREEP
ncbi:hypothetical protein VM1G_01136 [Cytospora mali]|uniref:Uncharacterized protein n=1 Tax=Cytospora mali TaxID=578113 RepID=A0A194VM96_CYTMA|nr:hypothetical protein VM1G_01136 [Valsa mali]